MITAKSLKILSNLIASSFLFATAVYTAEQGGKKEIEVKEHKAQQSSEQLFTLQATLKRQGLVSSVVFHPNNNTLAVGYADNTTIKILQIPNLKTITKLQNDGTTRALAFRPDGTA